MWMVVYRTWQSDWALTPQSAVGSRRLLGIMRGARLFAIALPIPSELRNSL
jgi:hypothetical protein